ncbi:uncharacterized protein LOC62_06G008592 [Vanrija pseudolonga]|uniref:Uncharacterized protein n=1 Tax=Vanrija pseudolonga TaxID=143232 RepID=A0AAF1BTQ7_9TREE|nr:hypothetical protein LOC62_06G008592 [Vanrija pseudolonga]
MRLALAIVALAASALAAPADSSSSASTSASKTTKSSSAKSSATSTTSAVPSPTVSPGFSGDGQTRVTFPGHSDWWVTGALNNLRWRWVASAQTLVSFTLHNDGTTKTQGGPDTGTMVAQGINGTAQRIDVTLSYLNQDPGDGYFIVMSDFYNPSQIYATSQTFTLKPAGNPIKAAGASALAAPGVLVGAGAVLAVAAGAMV